ncbi:virulence RhuM family protein [Pseudothauera rhizosphaerae]|uniref:virulence RhuM family protein n=1 Tax=Pseudothauera rhizosphaerae TaxID=2565932 RepID=UPI001E351709|nr:RhuM family protein [Pseudothauera rhizosphaerae]
MSTNDTNEILIYKAEDGSAVTEVRLAGETVWLRQEQMAELFGRERSVISRHLRNVFNEGELEADSVCAKFAHTAADGKTYQVEHYNLDVIISVGYRVKSQQGTRFRQWATRTLREHLTRGYTLHRQRFEANARELEAALRLVKKAAQSPELLADTGRGLVDVVTRYAQTFLLLQRYDEGLLAEPREERGGVLPKVAEARAALARLKADLMAARRGHGPLRPRAGGCLRGPARQPGPDRVRRAGLPERGGQGGAPALLRHQEPPVLGRQQA